MKHAPCFNSFQHTVVLSLAMSGQSEVEVEVGSEMEADAVEEGLPPREAEPLRPREEGGFVDADPPRVWVDMESFQMKKFNP